MSEAFQAGVLLVDKPKGVTSFSMVRAVRALTGIKKVGHAGTLDPFATGLLVICIGRPATKMISSLMEGDKEYRATMKLGVVSSTQDPEGELEEQGWERQIPEEEIITTLKRFTGTILQIPPSYSALKHKGKPLYHYARKGIKIEKEPRAVTIHTLDWIDKRSRVDRNDPFLSLHAVVEKGTYIRTLASDIGEMLECGAYLTGLRRTRSGCFSVSDAIVGTELNERSAIEKIRNRMLSVEDVQKLLQLIE